jgi:SAM-dependent methyltransferase
MTDEEFEDRVAAVSWMLDFAKDQVEVVRDKRVVEIGSGFGVGAIACLRKGAAEYLGIEPQPFGAGVIQLDGADAGFRVCYETAAKSIDKRKVHFFEGFADDWPGGGFDVCLIADVLEHVHDPKMIAASAWRLLKAGGMVVASTSPLYFSAHGHHLFDVFADRPWAHLYKDFSRDAVARKTSPFLLSEFDSLNGVTHAELTAAFLTAGFKITKERTLPQENVDFEQVRQRIKPEYLERVDLDVFNQSVSQFIAVKTRRRALPAPAIPAT